MSLKPFSKILLRSPLLSLKNAYSESINLTDLLIEGIYLSSPELYSEKQRYDELSSKEKEKLDLSLMKYFLRSCTRCTPYGTFAGSTVADLNDNITSITLCDSEKHARKIRVDMNYLTQIINEILKIDEIKRQVKYFPNNSLYEQSGNLRYVEYAIRDNVRTYSLTSVKKVKYLVSLLKFAEAGQTIDKLSDVLSIMEGVDREEADDFILSMIESQLLAPDLEPCITGKEPLSFLIEKLNDFKGIEPLKDRLKSIQELIKNPETGIVSYKKIEDELKKINLQIKVPKNTLQTDMFLCTESASVEENIITEIVTQYEKLSALYQGQGTPNLEEFKNRFISKYEQSEVPLAIALDSDSGVGYGNNNQFSTGKHSLINDLVIKNDLPSADRHQFENFILSKYIDSIRNNEMVINLTDEDLKKVNQNAKINLPKTLYLTGHLLKKDDKLSEHDFIFDLYITGPSASKLLGRFAHGDKRVYDLINEIHQDEEEAAPNIIFAEVAHLPQARATNILLRPLLSKYEIPYIGQSGIDTEYQIPISDLMVSVKNNEVVLRSKKHNKRVVPRLTSAHNFFTQTLPIYHFLGDLQSQGVPSMNLWNWNHLNSSAFLPRVSYKNLIIVKAQWNLSNEKIGSLPKDEREFLEFGAYLREKFQLPERVVYVESDNKLLIDLGSLAGVKLLLHYLQRQKTIKLEEFLFTNENCVVNDYLGLPYTNEIIIPVKNQNNVLSNNMTNRADTAKIRRKLLPGSEWLYFKIYCGPAVGESLLKTSILNFIERGIKNQMFEKFFFIRYFDESYNLRIRFLNHDPSKQEKLQQQFLKMIQPWIDNNAVDKMYIDTYIRELERYGHNTIESTESIFNNDSLAVVKFLSMLEDDGGDEYRLIFALRGIDMLLSDFHFSLPRKRLFMKDLAESFIMEFGKSAILTKQLNDKYRSMQQLIASHMIQENDEINGILEGVKLFQKRSKMNVLPIDFINGRINNPMELNGLISSVIHMFINRLYVNNQRKFELVIYFFLEKYYISTEARLKKGV